MGHAFVLRLPAIALSASLAFFVRLDAFPLGAIPHRQSQMIDGLTMEDVELYNESFRTRTIPRGPGLSDSPSTCHDWDWLRAVAGDPFMSDSVRRYTPGVLTGKWRGTEMVRVLHVLCRHSSDADGIGSVQPRLYACYDWGSRTFRLGWSFPSPFLLLFGRARAVFQGGRTL